MKHRFVHIRPLWMIVMVTLLVLLAGCGTQNGMDPISADTSGFFNHYLVYPFSTVIKTVASWFNDSYGVSIIIITLLIRLALFPLMKNQYKRQAVMKEKMNKLKPEMEPVQEKMKKAKTTEEKATAQKELMQLYQTHDVNPMAALGGCLPMLLQMPILIGFYYAIRRTGEIGTHTFGWFSLGHPDLVMTLLAMAVYFIQARVSMSGMDEVQRKQMAMFAYISPIMIGFVSFAAPAALPLYWCVGGLFMIAQTLLLKKLYNPSSSDEQSVSSVQTEHSK
ncbi:membrane protein insertase YidC [Aureibacillus halotolerans]|uniref:Membrane protein insertase YidC n=1 Tax=Aureibacillus halotolerans TaxID=1508390 RepID=A0A4V3D4J5_9BACI|nr:membrane protein insertase YidC [Aureibacillus halotolerans]TDQ36087.1 YidC/Oxa1 family membrane protein insertase [Aureibacillus halotolerans]